MIRCDTFICLRRVFRLMSEDFLSEKQKVEVRSQIYDFDYGLSACLSSSSHFSRRGTNLILFLHWTIQYHGQQTEGNLKMSGKFIVNGKPPWWENFVSCSFTSFVGSLNRENKTKKITWDKRYMFILFCILIFLNSYHSQECISCAYLSKFFELIKKCWLL